MKESIAGFGILLAIIGIPILTQQDTPETTGTVESVNWEEDTASDEPTYYEDTEYTEVMGTSSCTSDCSGHEAGWEWAETYEICDPDYDNGNSDSFNEGVNQWTEENC